MLLIYLILICFWLLSNHSKQRQYPIYRKPNVHTGFKYRKKPPWVINKIINLKAHLPAAGCRTLATNFNRRFGDKETVSKTWVAKVK